MKRLLMLAICLLAAGTLRAQQTIIVDSEKIFKSIAEYNNAISTLDNEAQKYQNEVDARFEEVEKLYNSYMEQRQSLSAATRENIESQILQKEQEATRYQESIFGQEGTLMKRRVALISPIQKRVFAAIEAYAKEVGAQVVIDKANNPALLFAAEAADRTEAMIAYLKQ